MANAPTIATVSTFLHSPIGVIAVIAFVLAAVLLVAAWFLR